MTPREEPDLEGRQGVLLLTGGVWSRGIHGTAEQWPWGWKEGRGRERDRTSSWSRGPGSGVSDSGGWAKGSQLVIPSPA